MVKWPGESRMRAGLEMSPEKASIGSLGALMQPPRGRQEEEVKDWAQGLCQMERREVGDEREPTLSSQGGAQECGPTGGRGHLVHDTGRSGKLRAWQLPPGNMGILVADSMG